MTGPEQPTGTLGSVKLSQVARPRGQLAQSAFVVHKTPHVCAEVYGTAAASATAKATMIFPVKRITASLYQNVFCTAM